jgi:cob(I)alamin adenosyltransferase
VIDPVLADCQVDLFTIGAEIATLPGQEGKLARHMALIGAEASVALERAIDAAEEGLPTLTAFVLPGGSKAAAELHYARCVVRRAERLLVELATAEPIRRELIVYVNRLSDLLFTLARKANQLLGVDDVPWVPKKSR